jgi:hypothetical protein
MNCSYSRNTSRNILMPFISKVYHCINKKPHRDTVRISIINVSEMLCHFAFQYRGKPTRISWGKAKQTNYRLGQAPWVPWARFSHMSRQSAHEGGKVVSPTHRPPLHPKNIPGTHFCQRLSQPRLRKNYVNEQFRWRHRESNPRLPRL